MRIIRRYTGGERLKSGGEKRQIGGEKRKSGVGVIWGVFVVFGTFFLFLGRSSCFGVVLLVLGSFLYVFMYFERNYIKLHQTYKTHKLAKI